MSSTSVMHLVCSMSEIEDNNKFNNIFVTYSPTNEQHDVSKELLGITSVFIVDATGTTWMAIMGGVGIACGTGLVLLCHTPAFVQDLAFIALAALFMPNI